MKLNEKDTKLLEILQENCRMSLKEVAKETKRPITTIHEKLKRFEKEGLIKKYTAILDCEKLDFGQTVFVFVSIKYHFSDETKPLSQREIAKKISRIPNVQDVHIIAGDWDILVKVKGKN
ncbi:MAG: Lrp/AsnC family transcriptional regulator, partial [Candidatus Aenigmarchaeota archaeon]|nr:Lrp/AsnC family transcriptional regulator [Candidatus Aenigmarchaeota archaeon]